ncbi:hypothetical protein PG996_007334 [Apiospora saccharicola]|uniref:Uncharacterized protein n=1 Tax=Apiospora saccharicola TaxID=335842 RepID=A0ABR1VAI4_9PEZI
MPPQQSPPFGPGQQQQENVTCGHEDWLIAAGPVLTWVLGLLFRPSTITLALTAESPTTAAPTALDAKLRPTAEAADNSKAGFISSRS